MSYNFTSIMSKKTDDQLITILTARSDEYTEEAIAAAKTEFDKRGIQIAKVQQVEKEQTIIKENEISRANEPLESEVKILATVFPLLARMIYAEQYRKNGYDRKLGEMGKAFWVGRLAYIGLITLVIILIKSFDK